MPMKVRKTKVGSVSKRSTGRSVQQQTTSAECGKQVQHHVYKEWLLKKLSQCSESFYIAFKYDAGGQAAGGTDRRGLCDSRKASVQAETFKGRLATHQKLARWSTCLAANTLLSTTKRRWLWVLERVCCLVFDKSMVRSLVSRLLNPRSATRGPWDREDPFVVLSRDQEFTAIGPFYLRRHPRCHMTSEILDHLGVLADSAEYRCARDNDEKHVSHFPGGIQHKFDGIFVLFGLQHGYLWERAVCYYNIAQPNELLVLEHFVPGVPSFMAYTSFLNHLEERWAYVEQRYGSGTSYT